MNTLIGLMKSANSSVHQGEKVGKLLDVDLYKKCRKRFAYDEQTGFLSYSKSAKLNYTGKDDLNNRPSGIVSINLRKFKICNIIWLLHNKCLPPSPIMFKDFDNKNTRIENMTLTPPEEPIYHGGGKLVDTIIKKEFKYKDGNLYNKFGRKVGYDYHHPAKHRRTRIKGVEYMLSVVIFIHHHHRRPVKPYFIDGNMQNTKIENIGENY